jgi:Tol biopolymer transport system component
MREEAGLCPSCHGQGPVGEPCTGTACALRGIHHLPEEEARRAMARSASQADPRLGQKVGEYLLADILGRGGFGKVYLALQLPIRMRTALKLMDGSAVEPDLAESMARKFEGEAAALAALTHPNIVRLLKYGVHEGTPFLVMEFVEGGRTLKGELHSGGLAGTPAPGVVAHVLRQILNALEAAHQRGIVHRDVKPENVMITRDGLSKILDFGLAKIDQREDHSGDRHDRTVTEETREGAVVGTSGYMSPEQASGQPVDFRSDQFAFGSLFYEMLTGKRAFHGPTRAETLAAIIRDEPEPIAAVAPRVPVPLRWIVERCLAKLPEERYASTRDLARDLQGARDHFSQVEGEASPLALAGRGRRRLWLSAGIALAAAALVASAYLFGSAARARDLPSFRRLTFRDGTVWTARVAPDGQTIVYGAAWNGGPIRIYSTRAEIPESVPLALPPANVLAISPAGEMAISLGARPAGPFLTAGMLARSTLAGGGQREILESVQAADWAPDGASLAVLRTVEGRSRIEFPMGKTLVEVPSGYLSHLRVSPAGDLVAYLEHPMRGDDGGLVAVVDRNGTRRVLSAGWVTVRGLAWSPDGREVWFTAAAGGSSRALHAVTLSGRRRLIFRAPGALTLHDISQEGRVLLTREGSREGIIGLPPGAEAERDLSWHDWSRPVDLTADGTAVLFDETGEGGGTGYAVYLRTTDGSPAVRLGEGHALALSPDGKWALSTPHRTPAELVLLPTGPGQSRRIPTGHFANIVRAAWSPGGESLLVAANEPGRGPRLYVQSADGGGVRAFTPEGTGAAWAVSPDGTRVAASDADRRLMLYDVAAGVEPLPIPGAEPGDVPVRFTPDGRALYVLVRGDGARAEIMRVDLTSGDREPWKEIVPADPVGVFGVPRVLLSADGRSYVYSFVRMLDELFLVDGLR